MQIQNVNESKPDFEPQKFTITFETKEELEAFYSVMNYSPICKFLGSFGFNTDVVRETINAEGFFNHTTNFEILDKTLIEFFKRYSKMFNKYELGNLSGTVKYKTR